MARKTRKKLNQNKLRSIYNEQTTKFTTNRQQTRMVNKRRLQSKTTFKQVEPIRKGLRRVSNTRMLEFDNDRKNAKVHDCKRERKRILSWRASQAIGGSRRLRTRTERLNDKERFKKYYC